MSPSNPHRPVSAGLRIAAAAAAGTLLAGGFAVAGESAGSSAKMPVDPVQPAEEKSFLEKLWDLPTLYNNPDNPFLQKLSIIGRYQGQYAVVDSDQGSFDDWETRRWRVGAEAKVFNDFKLKGEINVDEDFNPLYASLEEAYIAWAICDSFNLTIGKQKPHWSLEWATSSRKILTFERSLLVNQLHPDKSAGISADGAIGKWSYELGVYSADLDEEFGGFDAGQFYLASIGYNADDLCPITDELAIRFDYLYNDGDAGNNAVAPYSHSFSLNTQAKKGRFGLGTDILYATGDGVPDVFGVVIMPTYELIEDKLELVTRYQFADSDGADGLRAQSRYERAVPNITDGGRGDQYHAFYGGLNYYILDHRLKLMTGVEYADLDGGGDGGDYAGWTWVSGIRMYW